jgi:hypothetical protein
MQDLSNMAADSMWVTSQAGGNMVSSNEGAHTAPGSQPVDKLTDRDVQSDPHVEMPPQQAPGTDGKPSARGQDSYSPARPAWKATTTPNVVRAI